ncbi:MAG: PstS family phosphate ABC transporter substrate-binding protein [Magnetococcales bacterium]|nr:PstS family phosphate ABC transporter substrate-binding protein [Magnetococcales bacterium]MBF0321728.1 PstS family phosphate ABC transporter substrate-binding protein [Magnetococcales bacterium]
MDVKNLWLLLLAGLTFGSGGLGGWAWAGEDETVARVRIRSSETMAEALYGWAEGFRAEYPGVLLSVEGRGADNGVASLINGHVDIAASSRPIRIREKQLAVKRGHDEPVETIVGWDAVVLIVHPDNPLKGVHVEQLGDIFGIHPHIRRWTDLGVTVPGCVGQRLGLLSLKNKSGTYAFMRDLLMRDKRRMGRELGTFMTSRDLVQHVASNPCSIGFTAMAFVGGKVKPLCLMQGTGGSCLAPSPETVNARTYPLTRPLFLYTLGKPKGDVATFIQWVMGVTGQRLLQLAGFQPNPVSRP